MDSPSENSFTLPQPPPVVTTEQLLPPSRIKVFGVIHLVLAAYGVFVSGFGLLSALFMDQFMKKFPFMAQAQGSDVEKYAELMKQIQPYSIMQAVFGIILAIMLLLAGLSLLKERDKGRSQSNLYAWTSIVFKVINLIVSILVIIPLTKAMTMSNLPTSGPDEFNAMLDLSLTIMPLISILFTFLYPIVVLIMLNARSVRAYLAGR